ncbi:ribosomal biogenesis protein gar2 [Ophiostoma piceae UAMH 11346]|uniref:Ribosomal biogenesis protein gar2 n=1 Tax=Ophiostoma piceae (strain UAMH 11346) TaxID=1262450 RepID=S3BPH9_OPHP1|nr:ribosomal biogenesis protein gar2 [Ophiostoma piceae UAMH 11346]
MVKAKKTAGSVSDATPRKSSRISEAKRKATEEVSPASTKKIKAVVADKVAAVAPEEPDVGKAPAAAVKKAAQIKNAKKSTAVAAQNDESAEEQYGGIVYVGRIPHGFFENEMRSYFSQFGDIRRLRLSRNRKTGASKHYAFIEFTDRDVAEIVAKTMDNYLLFGHILRCSVVASERIPPNLFKGANRRFKAVPWNLMSGRRMAQPKPESDWSGKISREAKRRANRAAQLEKKLGYSFDAPEIKSVNTVEAPVSAIEDKKVDEKLVEAAAPAVAEPEAVPVAAKGKKAKGKKVKA